MGEGNSVGTATSSGEDGTDPLMPADIAAEMGGKASSSIGSVGDEGRCVGTGSSAGDVATPV